MAVGSWFCALLGFLLEYCYWPLMVLMKRYWVHSFYCLFLRRSISFSHFTCKSFTKLTIYFCGWCFYMIYAIIVEREIMTEHGGFQFSIRQLILSWETWATHVLRISWNVIHLTLDRHCIRVLWVLMLNDGNVLLTCFCSMLRSFVNTFSLDCGGLLLVLHLLLVLVSYWIQPIIKDSIKRTNISHQCCMNSFGGLKLLCAEGSLFSINVVKG